MDNKYGTLAECAEYLRVSIDVMYEIARIKDFPAAKVGKRKWRVRMDRVDEWWEKRLLDKEDNI